MVGFEAQVVMCFSSILIDCQKMHDGMVQVSWSISLNLYHGFWSKSSYEGSDRFHKRGNATVSMLW